jgi:hypothetical protein
MVPQTLIEPPDDRSFCGTVRVSLKNGGKKRRKKGIWDKGSETEKKVNFWGENFFYSGCCNFEKGNEFEKGKWRWCRMNYKSRKGRRYHQTCVWEQSWRLDPIFIRWFVVLLPRLVLMVGLLCHMGPNLSGMIPFPNWICTLQLLRQVPLFAVGLGIDMWW